MRHVILYKRRHEKGILRIEEDDNGKKRILKHGIDFDGKKSMKEIERRMKQKKMRPPTR